MKTRIETTSTLPSYHVKMRRIMILRIHVDLHIVNRCNEGYSGRPVEVQADCR